MGTEGRAQRLWLQRGGQSQGKGTRYPPGEEAGESFPVTLPLQQRCLPYLSGCISVRSAGDPVTALPWSRSERVNTLLDVSHTNSRTAQLGLLPRKSTERMFEGWPVPQGPAVLLRPQHLGSVSAVSPTCKKAVTKQLSSCPLLLACLHLVSSGSGSSTRLVLPACQPLRSRPFHIWNLG